LGEAEVVVGDQADAVGDKASGFELNVINNQVNVWRLSVGDNTAIPKPLTLRLELETGNGNLLNETDNSRDNNIEQVSVQTLTLGT
jgi:hypothetical protein